MKVKKKLDLAKRLKIITRGDYRGFMAIGGRMIRDDVISNIKHQITPNGSALQRNAPSTLKLKARYGLGTKSLIARFRLFISQSTYSMKIKKNSVQVFVKDVRKKIGQMLERKGYYFWGMSKITREKIFQKWRKYIKRGIR